MNHALCYPLVEWIIQLLAIHDDVLVRYFSTDDAVYIFNSQMMLVLKPNYDMSVWKSSFLKLNGVNVRNYLSKNMPLRDIFHQLLMFLLEDSATNIRPV